MRLLTLLLLAGLPLGAQTVTQYGPIYGPGYAVETLPDHSLLVVGAGGSQSVNDVALHRIAPNGDVLWKQVLPAALPEEFSGFQLTQDGNAVVLTTVSSIWPTYERYLSLYKYDPDGNLLWMHDSLPTPSHPFGLDLLELENGDLLLGGAIQAPSTYPESYLARFDADGNLLWDQVWGQPNVLYRVFSLAEAPNGDLFFAGTQGSQIAWGRTDAAGNVLWTQEIGPGTPGEIAVLSDGYALASVFAVAGLPFPRIYRMNAAGDVVWTHAQEPPLPPARVGSLIPSGDGGLLVAGGIVNASMPAPQDVIPYWYKLDDQGQLAWQQSYVIDTLTTQFGAEGYFSDITQTANGNYTLVGGWGDPFDQLFDVLILLQEAVDPTVNTTAPAVPAPVLVFPNPSPGSFCWEVGETTSPVDVELIAVSGQRRLLSNQPPSGCSTVADLPDGMYFVEFRQKETVLGRTKLMYRPR